MKANYENLKAFLENGNDTQTLTFKQIEIVTGSELSPVYIARKAMDFENSRIRMAAEKAGFHLTEVNYNRAFVRFERVEARNVEENLVVPAGDLGRDLDASIAYFKANWSSVGGEYVPFCGKYDNLDDVYFNAGMQAYRAAMKRAIKFDGVPQNVRNELRLESCRYLAERFVVLFALTDLDFDSYNAWAEETARHIRSIYRNRGVTDYTIGNAQKIINVALKFVMSSDIVDYHHDVFKYCHFPVDGRIQMTIRQQLRVGLLHQNGEDRYGYSSWSSNDNWEDFLDYQIRVREAVLRHGFYSPMVWEATHWE